MSPSSVCSSAHRPSARVIVEKRKEAIVNIGIGVGALVLIIILIVIFVL